MGPQIYEINFRKSYFCARNTFQRTSDRSINSREISNFLAVVYEHHVDGSVVYRMFLEAIGLADASFQEVALDGTLEKLFGYGYHDAVQSVQFIFATRPPATAQNAEVHVLSPGDQALYCLYRADALLF